MLDRPSNTIANPITIRYRSTLETNTAAAQTGREYLSKTRTDRNAVPKANGMFQCHPVCSNHVYQVGRGRPTPETNMAKSCDTGNTR